MKPLPPPPLSLLRTLRSTPAPLSLLLPPPPPFTISCPPHPLEFHLSLPIHSMLWCNVFHVFNYQHLSLSLSLSLSSLSLLSFSLLSLLFRISYEFHTPSHFQPFINK